MAESTLISLEELAQHNGTDPSKPLYLALQGTVFDVTAGKAFYGPGGPYEVFAGKECARALATMKIEASACTDDLEGLDEKQLKTLADWDKKFRSKYQVVGKVATTHGYYQQLHTVAGAVDQVSSDQRQSAVQSDSEVARVMHTQKGQTLPDNVTSVRQGQLSGSKQASAVSQQPWHRPTVLLIAVVAAVIAFIWQAARTAL